MFSGNSKAFLRFLIRNFVNNRGTNYRLTAKRLGVLILALIIYLPVEIFIWIGFLLDEIFFPAYRDIKITQPVFIIGNPRSGTTFLQRLMARDTDNFLSMKTWEIFGSPSIFTRKLISGIVRVGRSVGMPVTRRIRKVEQLWKDDDKIHRFRLRAPEEDEYLFVHTFSTMKIWSFASMEKESDPYIFYDQEMSEKDKKRNMAYYEKCLQRHYFYHGQPAVHYLSKNPNFSPAIDTLLAKFPDAKFIYLIRNPSEAVPSHISLKNREWKMLGSPLTDYACSDFIIKSSVHWYNYPLEKLRALPDDQAAIVKFEDLIQDAEKTVSGIYDQLGFTVSEKFRSLLELESRRSKDHKSQHYYSLSDMNIKEEQIRDQFGSVMKEFDYTS